MSRTQQNPRGSIRHWLLALLIPGTIALLVYDSRNDYLALTAVTQEAYDSALLEPAKVLETSVAFNEDGTLRIDPPFYAQVMLESRAGSRKYFRVEEISPMVLSLAGARTKGLTGQTLLGMRGLPRPEVLADNEGVPVFYNTLFSNDEIRMVAVWRDLHFQGTHRQVLIMVGESLDMRLRTQQQAWREGLFRDARMLLLVVLLVWFSVQWALRPLGELRREIKTRKVDDLTPLDADQVPREVAPLVEAVNHHIDLYRRVLDKQAQFLADASHQLRTPLAIMRTQAQYARREPDTDRMRETLDAIIKQLGQTSRLTEQLLSLAHASRKDAAARTEIDLNALAREVVLQYLPLARERQQDLGWLDTAEGAQDGDGADEGHIWVLGNEAELHESIANLIHNAINHSGTASVITVSAGIHEGYAYVSVSDNGVGLDPSLRESVFMRFDRGARRGHTVSRGGSGLGLAIALAYAERNRGTIALSDGDPSPGGTGLCATLKLPAIQPDAA